MPKGEQTKKPRSPGKGPITRAPRKGAEGRARIAAAHAGSEAALDRKRQAAMLAILAALRGGATRKAACAAARVSHEALYSWLREKRTVHLPETKDAEGNVSLPAEEIPFPEAVEQAEQAAVLFHLQTIRRAATEAERVYHYDRDGNLLREVVKYDWRAAAWWIEHHPSTKEDWRAVQRQEITGPNGGPIQSEGIVTFRPDPQWLAEYASSLGDLPPEVATPMLAPGDAKNVTPTEGDETP